MNGDKSNIELEEYKSKWAYIVHIESIQFKYIQWYYGIVGALLTFIFSDKFGGIEINTLHSQTFIPFLFLQVYSIFVILRLLYQKRNYNTYIDRISEIEGSKEVDTKKDFRFKLLSVFKLQYYSMVMIASIITFLLTESLSNSIYLSCTTAVIHLIGFMGLSFSKIMKS